MSLRSDLYTEVLSELSSRPFGVIPFGGCAIKREAIEIGISNGDFNRMGFDVSFSEDYNRINKHSIAGFTKHIIPK
jgi:hypothetical protein